METSIGIGCATGPMLGSFVYGQVGYAWTFLIWGMLLLPMAIFLFFVAKPKDVIAKYRAMETDITEPLERHQSEIIIQQIEEEKQDKNDVK